MPMANATHSTPVSEHQLSLTVDQDAFYETVDQLDALTMMLGAWLDTSNLSPQSLGTIDIFRRIANDLRYHFDSVVSSLERADHVERAEKPRHLTTADVPTDAERQALRREYIGLIMRDTDTTRICEAYALPKETLRDILYALIDAPQKVYTHEGDGLRTPGSGNLSEGPIPDHFREEAVIDRLTGAAGDGREAV